MNLDNEDQYLVDQLRLQNNQALSDLIDKYGNSIYRTSVLLLRDRQLAEDTVQETFISAFQNMDQFNASGSFKGWLITIAINHCRTIMRKAWWKRMTFRLIEPYELTSKEPGPEEKVVADSLMEQIQQLPYQYREVIVLYYYQELRVSEISQLLNIKEGTVKSHLHRARSMLRTVLMEGEWNHA